MSNRKLSLQGFFHNLGRLYRKITKSFVTRVLRYVLFYQRRGKLSTAGFILPTTVLLILVVALTVGALTFRAYNRNIQVIGEAQQRVIYNAATPAIDRARSKIEFLFDSTKDNRLPSGVPSQITLEAMLLNDGKTRKDETFPTLLDPTTGTLTKYPYTFPDEERLDINNDGRLDNAWYYRTDTNGDGRVDGADSTVVYSIVLNTPLATPKSGTTAARSIATALLDTQDDKKAYERWVRQAPLSIDGALGCLTNSGGGNAGPDGWFEDKTATAILRKNFQVDALVIPGNGSGTKATLEFTQDRELNRGNKWGAWFRHDLEIYPGADFKWNGAMHTEGSLIVGGDKFKAYLISAPNSCLYNPASNSEITVGSMRKLGANGTPDPKNDLLGLVAAGVVKTGKVEAGDKADIHLHGSNPPTDAANRVQLDSRTASSKATTNPIDITLDPETVLMEDGYTNRAPDPGTTKTDRNNRTDYVKAGKENVPDLRKPGAAQRIRPESADTPYVDDLYRADDRWGPKPRYKKVIVPTNDFGKPIPATQTDLLNNSVPDDDTEASGVGLDGYWERRARIKGLRILVGQRLELGNLFTWYAPTDKPEPGYLKGDGYVGTGNRDVDQVLGIKDDYEYEGDPLYPPTVKPYPTVRPTATPPDPATPEGISSVALHRRTLRDNLSAVQSTAIYHAAADDQKDYPIACLATTSHPGTLWTLRQAITFRPFEFFGSDGNPDSPNRLLTNFFTGVGTNGWEFNPPARNYATFKSQIENSDSSLRKALQNLANFAGDHQTLSGVLKSGAFPPTPNDPVYIHPYPALSMWGDYSNLKRALSNLGANFDSLSIADKTYIQTAACTLGMLAYNIDQLQKFDPSAINPINPAVAPNDKDLRASTRTRLMAKLGRDLWMLMDGVNNIGLRDNSEKPRGEADNPEVLPREQLATYGYRNTRPTVTANQIVDPSAYKAEDYKNVTPEALIAALRQYLLRTDKGADGRDLTPDHPDFIEEMRLAETIMLNHQIRRDRTFGFKPSPAFGQYAVFPRTVNPVEMVTACDPDQFVFTTGTDGDALLRSDMRNSPEILSSRPSTILSSTSLNAPPTSDYPTVFPTPRDSGSTGRALSQYRYALSRLCGTLDTTGTQVLPKFPALYYLFPEVAHDYDGDSTAGGYDHQQPATEPYVADDYIKSINAASSSSAPFQPISAQPATGRAGYATPEFQILKGNATYTALSRKPAPANPACLTDASAATCATVRVFPIPDRRVSDVALEPRALTDWRLPYLTSPRPYDVATAGTEPPSSDKANFSPNRILRADTPRENLTEIAIPFLDRAFFDGRQLMLSRTLDIDLGMLRGTQLGFRDANTRAWTPAKDDVWLPISGIVYAFREDAVREDAISRPACTGANCEMDLRNPDRSVDPPVRNGVSTKAIDKYPDPDRRINGFRLRNGVQVMRNRSLEGKAVNAADNTKGLSLFTDQPVYIQGDFNLHQSGSDDTIGTRLEEFEQLLPANFNETQFYTERKTPNNNFAKAEEDRWRPSEILADSISILSNGFCDGSIADAFIQYNRDAIIGAFGATPSKRYPVPDAQMLKLKAVGDASEDRDYYHQVGNGLFDPGCASAKYTSFHNQNRPAQQMDGKNPGSKDGWTWVGENSRYDGIANRRINMGDNQNRTGHWVDITSPIKISRTGHPFVVRPRDATPPARDTDAPGRVLPPIPYNVVFPTQTYYGYGDDVGSGFYASGSDRDNTLLRAVNSRVNSIVVSGIVPSRPQQGYGGLHNFPRFLEFWRDKDLNFSGSFIQLSYSNYATSPFELENLEPWSDSSKPPSDPVKENILYYQPPNRRWGYDVALQFSPASPAAARFVTPSKNRTEYYVEPPANDPYIANLCDAAKSKLTLNTNCPRR